MSRITINDVVSRVRNQIKGVSQDSFVTDRMIYSFVIKNAKFLMRREDRTNKLMLFSSVIQTMDFVELQEVDKVEACCTGIKSDCTIKRTKDKLPIFMQGYYGPLIRSVTSLDNSERLQPIVPSSYIPMSNSKNFKYNKYKYFWYLNDYLYFPNLEWDAVRIEGIFEDDISQWTCEEDSCKPRQDQLFSIPDYLLAELEGMVLKDFMVLYQIPMDQAKDKQSLTR
jgi:hypothetical protein